MMGGYDSTRKRRSKGDLFLVLALCIVCKTLGSSYHLTNKTLQTSALSTSPACADEVSPEVSIGTARTRFVQWSGNERLLFYSFFIICSMRIIMQVLLFYYLVDIRFILPSYFRLLNKLPIVTVITIAP
jgi:hypothetical protein